MGGNWGRKVIGTGKVYLVGALRNHSRRNDFAAKGNSGNGFGAGEGHHILWPYRVSLGKGAAFSSAQFIAAGFLFIVTTGAIIFGWLPSVGHSPHPAGALVGVVFLGLSRKQHKPI